ncbi:glycoside hydrolase family 13 protein [Flammeovirga agarivorans]|uniref:Glycoside hydrolase family 13 protein n=1 Tax=Flammeovirga agarivorans TaxID=2726742 RepID=A0A7X8SPQ1_9BACT|nr:glycoside hydrolase family 13 protein [Flammeovirga agarivorans]NLR94109.1 glycoside hydrolase family 13 protein [Flammeovirga agarivorans]
MSTPCNAIEKIEPPFWWKGMKNSSLQIMIYGRNIANTSPSIEESNVLLSKIEKLDNPNYLLLYLDLSHHRLPDTFLISFSKNGKQVDQKEYHLKDRQEEQCKNVGFNTSDVVYLIMPDRFSNGDPSIDNVDGMKEKVNRNAPFGRHGGDLKGIRNHLDYFVDLGVTALWLNPIQENNAQKYSYHGYGITDFYKVDPRLGTNQGYKSLVSLCHQLGLKVIMDLVFNHIGIDHWWMSDLPSLDWLNHQYYWDEGQKDSSFFGTNYQVTKQHDPYTSDEDFKANVEGWFTKDMPDLNQNNPFLAEYLIQNSIWWIEFSGINGIRMDTFGYAFKAFTSTWTKAILEEYPNFNIVGEVLVRETPVVAYFAGGAKNFDGYDSSLPSVTDMPLTFMANESFAKGDSKSEWDTPMRRLANHLAQDHLFKNPYNLMTCLDNHDVNRVMSNLKDPKRVQLALTFLLTTRGIPQIYYGTELLFEGLESDHSSLRLDFPGGWKGDKRSAFTKEGRTKSEEEMFSYIKRILHWRKTCQVIHNGRLVHFIPENDVYVYFRAFKDDTVMVLLNNNETKSITVSTANFNSMIKGAKKGYDVISDRNIDDLPILTIQPKTGMIIELK